MKRVIKRVKDCRAFGWDIKYIVYYGPKYGRYSAVFYSQNYEHARPHLKMHMSESTLLQRNDAYFTPGFDTEMSTIAKSLRIVDLNFNPVNTSNAGC